MSVTHNWVPTHSLGNSVLDQPFTHVVLVVKHGRLTVHHSHAVLTLNKFEVDMTTLLGGVTPPKKSTKWHEFHKNATIKVLT